MFLGSYADLTGHTIGGFTIFQLARRDRAKAPVWRAICQQCKQENIFTHAKLTNAAETNAAAEVLFCQNAACSRSRIPPVHQDTLSDIRRAEREAQREAERQRRQEEERAAQEAARQNAIRAEKVRWIRFANSQMQVGIMPTDEQFMSFERWNLQSEHWRQEVLKRIQV